MVSSCRVAEDAHASKEHCIRAEQHEDAGVLEKNLQAFLCVLPYLGIKELLAVELVCRVLHDATAKSPNLWRQIVVRQPLSQFLTDYVLQTLVWRGNGSTEVVMLDRCPHITTQGLEDAIDGCTKLQKLYVPHCRQIRAPAICDFLTGPWKGRCIPFLRLRGTREVFQISADQLHFLTVALEMQAAGVPAQQRPPQLASRMGTPGEAVLRSLPEESSALEIRLNWEKSGAYDRQKAFLHKCGEQVLSKDWLADDGRFIDVDVCPRCGGVAQVFDCSRKDQHVVCVPGNDVLLFPAQVREVSSYGRNQCRACISCIPRCVQCGICVNREEIGNRAICGCFVCNSCRPGLPECVHCGEWCCSGHLTREVFIQTSERYFQCLLCAGADDFFEDEGDDGASWGYPT